jgi:hypothetical protein
MTVGEEKIGVTRRRLPVVEVPTEVLVQVENVLNRYTYLYDYGNAEQLGHVFTGDATLDTNPPGLREGLPVTGLENIIEFLGSRYDANELFQRRHVITNLYISEYTADRLRSHVYLHVTKSIPGTFAAPDLVLAGEYEDVMVRNADGCWRIRERLVHEDRMGPH